LAIASLSRKECPIEELFNPFISHRGGLCPGPSESSSGFRQVLKRFFFEDFDPAAVGLNQALGTQFCEDAGESLRYGAQKACELGFGDVELKILYPLVLVAQIEEVGGEPARDFFEGKIVDQGGESSETLGQNRQHVQGKRGILLDEIHKGFSREKENPALLQGLGIGWELLARKDGDLSERFPRPKEVEDLFLALRGQLEYFDPAGDDDVESVSLLPFGENGFAFSEYLVRYDHGQVLDLLVRQTFKERNVGDVAKDRQGVIPL